MKGDDGREATGRVQGRCVQRAYLTVAFADDNAERDLDPTQVTQLVGLRPTRSHRRGDRYGPDQRVHRHAGWYVEVQRRHEYDTEVVLAELLDVIEPHAEGLARARQALGLVAGANVVVEMYTVRDPGGEVLVTTPALSLSAATIRRIAELDLWLDCDQYVY